jgi:hypothetical protein
MQADSEITVYFDSPLLSCVYVREGQEIFIVHKSRENVVTKYRLVVTAKGLAMEKIKMTER